jgi:hypothetical protein
MDKPVIIPIKHELNPFCCGVSGISDLYYWKSGQKLPQYYLHWASGMCGFSYIKNKRALPSRMVFFGINPDNQYKNIEKILNCEYACFENHLFKTTLDFIKSNIDKNTPVILGPLDMYYLPYLKYFKKEHIPIHFLLAAGYDRDNVIIYDCDKSEKQYIPFDLIEKALDVNVPGIGKRNSARVFEFGKEIPGLKEIALKSLKLKTDFMLNPPINNFGIKGMKKLAAEMENWDEELPKKEINAVLANMLYYMDRKFENKYFDCGRRAFADEFIKSTAEILNKKELTGLIDKYRESGKILDSIGRTIKSGKYKTKDIAQKFLESAQIEEEIYQGIDKILTSSTFPTLR